MDALIYTVMSGAERIQRAQAVHANNLANLETAGFRANLEQASAAQVKGYGYDGRHLAQARSDVVSARAGGQRDTGRDLDLAIQGEGLFAVAQDGPDGPEAYTRSGNFTVDAQGQLRLGRHAVLGEGGPIVLPPHDKLEILADGTVAILTGNQAELQAVDRLKRVRPDFAEMTKNEAGLLVTRDGSAPASDPSVQVAGGKLEASNVSAVEEMVSTMNLARDFELQMRLFKAADGMADSGNRLMRE
ncbi:flagellar basal body rod protein FlgF [Roseateles amylovorans]|jgi:flagellar basal-body rod protein FlgF|uniref:Flagellar basal-body rod protein FlgF n=1 Tax=Roseateles amylovorans TaxID=2978473 RepID=A0ABY6AVJ3_9BURK|nr:flagellar basal body rod protein FlgF [Roseateles amylovorans]UXH76882.1 flagellar basal body rod protein FlgF [Roseateles amylovorans]